MTSLPQIEPAIDVQQIETGSDTEEKDFVSILLKLKQAKQAQENARKRKITQEMERDVRENFQREIRDKVKRFKKKWALRIHQLLERVNSQKSAASSLLQRLEVLHRDCNSVRDSRRLEMLRLGGTFQSIDAEVELVVQQHSFVDSGEKMRGQIENKLTQLEGMLKKIQADNNRDDKFSRLLKTIISSM